MDGQCRAWALIRPIRRMPTVTRIWTCSTLFSIRGIPGRWTRTHSDMSPHSHRLSNMPFILDECLLISHCCFVIDDVSLSLLLLQISYIFLYRLYAVCSGTHISRTPHSESVSPGWHWMRMICGMPHWRSRECFTRQMDNKWAFHYRYTFYFFILSLSFHFFFAFIFTRRILLSVHIIFICAKAHLIDATCCAVWRGSPSSLRYKLSKPRIAINIGGIDLLLFG